MRKQFFLYFITLLIISLSVSCSSPYATTGEHKYLHSKNNNKLVVPKPLHDNNLNDFYNLPSQEQHAKLKVDLIPPQQPEGRTAKCLKTN